MRGEGDERAKMPELYRKLVVGLLGRRRDESYEADRLQIERREPEPRSPR